MEGIKTGYESENQETRQEETGERVRENGMMKVLV